MRARTALLILAAMLAAIPVAAAVAEHATGHPDWSCCPAVRAFPKDFPELVDSEWGYLLGGWGGIERGTPIERTPVIFVHGNGEDASFWDLQNESAAAVNVRQRFRKAGYSDQELWAFSYNGQACGNNTCQTSNDVNVPDLVAFVRAVLEYTGAPKVDIVAHSLGVTIVRRGLHEAPALQDLVEDAVFASGANHGTTVCRGSEGVVGCDEIHPGSPWLEEMNVDETPGDVRYVTVCDCTGVVDHFFLGPDATSPQLDGARNLELPASAHFMTARGPDAVPVFLPLVARASRAPVDEPTVLPRRERRRPLPATGVAGSTVGILSVIGAALAWRGRRVVLR